jgi:hypothetical protein
MDSLPPAHHHRRELAAALDQLVRELLYFRRFGGHVDPARLHHDRVDQGVDAPDIDGSRRRIDLHVPIVRLQAHALDRHHQQKHCDDRQKSGDGIDFVGHAQATGAAHKADKPLQRRGRGLRPKAHRHCVHDAPIRSRMAENWSRRASGDFTASSRFIFRRSHAPEHLFAKRSEEAALRLHRLICRPRDQSLRAAGVGRDDGLNAQGTPTARDNGCWSACKWPAC